MITTSVLSKIPANELCVAGTGLSKVNERVSSLRSGSCNFDIFLNIVPWFYILTNSLWSRLYVHSPIKNSNPMWNIRIWKKIKYIKDSKNITFSQQQRQKFSNNTAEKTLLTKYSDNFFFFLVNCNRGSFSIHHIISYVLLKHYLKIANSPRSVRRIISFVRHNKIVRSWWTFNNCSFDFVEMASFLVCNANAKLLILNRCRMRMRRLFYYSLFLSRGANKAKIVSHWLIVL